MAQSSLETLVFKYDEDKAKKDQLKALVEHLTSILIKLTKSSEAIKPVTSSLDEQVMKRVEQVVSWSIIIGQWMGKMLSQGI